MMDSSDGARRREDKSYNKGAAGGLRSLGRWSELRQCFPGGSGGRRSLKMASGVEREERHGTWAMKDSNEGRSSRDGLGRDDEKCGGQLKRCCLLVRPGAPVRMGPQAGAAQHSNIPLARRQSFSSGALLIAPVGCKVTGRCEAAVSAGCCHAGC